ncbi:MAG TPA: response regulator [Verrucomicrobiae bacterium]|jgi:CheY-like chemotaxis protein|nr:response regulator [Verrucomicrobiae bacterium]
MKKMILLADDSIDDELFFKHVLKAAGVENPVHVVRDGKEVIAYLKGEGPYADRERFPRPVVLFLDLSMPGMDGWEVLKWLQSQPNRKDLLVIVLAGSSQRRRLREVYEMGANSFLFKPFSKAELEGLIFHWPDAWTISKPEPPMPPPPPSQQPGNRPAI